MSAKMGMSPTDQPVLLKVLDPVADEVYGDLYFELHQEKQEVYVVTHVDQGAWPEGIGAIQLGFASQVRKLYKSDDEFKLAYLSAVKEYEAVRRQVDFLLDQKKTAAALDPQTPASSLQLIEWINELSQHSENKELIKQEHRLRHIMNSFVERHPLMLGDVVTVPKLVPHALQHGVRVVEFQTPVYERKILSFGQKVLTQTHWDTEVALELVDFEFAQLKPAELVLSTPQMLIERIVNFDDFEVQRIQLAGSYKIQGHRYWVLMVLSGQLKLGELQGAENIRAGQALLIPGSGEERLITSSDPCIFLLATPR